MANTKHAAQTSTDCIHIIQTFVYTNAAARTGAIGLVAADIGKVAKQTDEDTYRILINHSPITWKEISSYTIVDEVDAQAVVNATFYKNEQLLSQGRAMKMTVMGATTITEIDDVSHLRLSDC